MMKLGNNKTLLFIAIAAVIVWMLFGNQQQAMKSKYTLGGDGYAPAGLEGAGIDLSESCAQNSGVGLASSLLPREVASQEDFGEFAPDDILKGQNFLDPRQQIGFPETLGGTLRNANQQIRSDPPNPKQAFVWNNSTIVPDLMQRKMCS
tara:strand:+ start:114 stop:560 length:447 start_codon:yes stop_codon:yes gene_type:complete